VSIETRSRLGLAVAALLAAGDVSGRSRHAEPATANVADTANAASRRLLGAVTGATVEK
jgi:hypothetical protein